MHFYLGSLPEGIQKQAKAVGNARLGEQVRFGIDPTWAYWRKFASKPYSDAIINGESSAR
jgi:hypothetical protein